MPRQVSIDESTPLVARAAAPEDSFQYSDDDEDDDLDLIRPSERNKYEAKMADRLSVRLLAVPDDDEETQDRILRRSLGIPSSNQLSSSLRLGSRGHLLDGLEEVEEDEEFKLQEEYMARRRLWTMVALAVGALVLMVTAISYGVKVIGPPNQPVGPYMLLERQEGEDFFSFYNFYEGRDSVGSNGFNMYVGKDAAESIGIANVIMEEDELDVYNLLDTRRFQAQSEGIDTTTETAQPKKEPFIYMGSAPTKEGPRNSIRLEGLRRFNRGLFMYVRSVKRRE